MKRNRLTLALASLAALATFAGCSANTSTAADSTNAAAASSTSASSTTTTAASTNSGNWDSNTVLGKLMAANQSSHYQAADVTVDESKVVEVTLNGTSATAEGNGIKVDGSTVTITAGGTYRLTGKLTGQIVVTAKTENVQIILNGVELTNTTGSPFVITAADEVNIVLADGTTNTISDAKSYSDTGTDAPNAAIDSASDLTIAGNGTLNVTGNFNDAINSGDGLVIADGNITVNAVDDGLRGKDYVIVSGGTLKITSGGDALKSDNETDADRGYVYISGGTTTIEAGDDGISAFNDIAITDGTITVSKSNEGIEAQSIAIAGGTINVTSSDDGINVSGTNPQFVDIAGGTTTINAQGDGFDSNGAASMSGGTLIVYGPENNGNGAIDVDNGFTVTGGTLWALGSSGMAVTPAQASTQAFVSATLSQSTSGSVQIKDSSGKVIAETSSDKQFASVIYSSSAISTDGTYTLALNGSDAGTASVNQYQAGMGGGPGGGA